MPKPRTFDVFGATITIGIRGSETNGRLSLVEGTFVPGGFAPLPHIHIDEEESFYVIAGSFEFLVGGVSHEGKPGSFLHVPSGVVHGFKIAGDVPGRILFVHSPPIDGFFQGLADLAARGPLERGSLRQLMNEWNMDTTEA